MSTWREQKPGEKNEGQLLLSFISSHKFVTIQTVYRWLLRFYHCLQLILVFKVHSTRAASPSKGRSSGISPTFQKLFFF